MTDRQTDPWAGVEAENMFYGQDAYYYEADAVDKARAADAAQIVAWRKWANNAETQIANLTAQIEEVHRELHERDERDQNLLWKVAHDLLETQNDTLRAERDAAQQENQTLREAAQAILDLGRADLSLQSHNKVWRAFRAALAPRPQEPKR